MLLIMINCHLRLGWRGLNHSPVFCRFLINMLNVLILKIRLHGYSVTWDGAHWAWDDCCCVDDKHNHYHSIFFLLKKNSKTTIPMIFIQYSILYSSQLWLVLFFIYIKLPESNFTLWHVFGPCRKWKLIYLFF